MGPRVKIQYRDRNVLMRPSMPDFDFQLTGLIQSLDNNVFLAEALFFPEISCLGDERNLLYRALAINARYIVEKLESLQIFRRHLAGNPIIEDLIVLLPPPAHSTAWREPV